MTILFLIVAVLFFLGAYIYTRWRSASITKDESGKIADYATILQNLAVFISILVAGGWAGYTFDALKQKESAELVYNQLKEKINNTESSDIKIDVEIVNYQSELAKNDERTKGLIINVTIANKGIKRIDFDLADLPLSVYKVKAYEDKLGYESKMTPKLIKTPYKLYDKDSTLVHLKQWSSMIDSKRTLSYFVTVAPESMYYIVFSTPVSFKKDNSIATEIPDDLLETKCSEDETCNWFASKYVYIDDSNK